MRAGKSLKETFLIYLTIVFIKQIKNVSSCLSAHIGGGAQAGEAGFGGACVLQILGLHQGGWRDRS